MDNHRGGDPGWSVEIGTTNQLAIDNETVETKYNYGTDSYDYNLGKSIINLTDNPDNIKSLNVTVDGQTYDISNHKFKDEDYMIFGYDDAESQELFRYYPVVLNFLDGLNWTINKIRFQTEGPHNITVNIEYESKEYQVSEDFENVIETISPKIPQITSEDYGKIVVAEKDGYQFSPEPVIFKDENTGGYTCNKDFDYIKNNIDNPWFNLYLFKDGSIQGTRRTHRYYPVYIDFLYPKGYTNPSSINIRFETKYQGYLRVIDIDYMVDGTISATTKQVALTDA